MAGITRIHITNPTNGNGADRFNDSRRCWNSAHQLYRKIFNDIGGGLQEEDVITECTKDEFIAGYDYSLGIDVILTLMTNQSLTMQEKFLFTTFDTVTVEYMQDWRAEIPGDWFNMRAQLYFTGYDYKKVGIFDKWILLNWPAVVLATSQGRIPWMLNRNNHNGARADFRYVFFKSIPDDVIVARSNPIAQAKLPLGWIS